MPLLGKQSEATGHTVHSPTAALTMAAEEAESRRSADSAAGSDAPSADSACLPSTFA